MSKPSITNCPNTFFRKVHSFNCIFSSLSCFACVQIRHNPLSGGYCGEVPPLPIPNREVKPTCADGTAMQCGRVGRRLLSMKSLRFRKISEAFLFFFPRIFFFSAGVILLRGAFTSDFFFIVFLHRDFSSSDFTDDSEGNLTYRITHGFSRNLAAGQWLASEMSFYCFCHADVADDADFFIDYFSPTDFTDFL